MENMDFLPVSRDEMIERGWWWYDFLLVTGDAYVDHPSFGPSVIGRVLEAEGYRVAVLAQPDWHSAADFAAFGRPKLAVLIGAGNLDSMVAHYTAAKKRRKSLANSSAVEYRSAARFSIAFVTIVSRSIGIRRLICRNRCGSSNAIRCTSSGSLSPPYAGVSDNHS